MSLILGNSTIHATDSVRSPTGLQSSGGLQVSAIVESCNFHLRQISLVRRYISVDTCLLAVLV